VAAKKNAKRPVIVPIATIITEDLRRLIADSAGIVRNRSGQRRELKSHLGTLGCRTVFIFGQNWPRTHFSHVMSDGAKVPNRLGRPLLLGDKETEGTFDDIPVMYDKMFRSLYAALTKTTIATYGVRIAMTGLL
jgi:hypothetical protein